VVGWPSLYMETCLTAIGRIRSVFPPKLPPNHHCVCLTARWGRPNTPPSHLCPPSFSGTLPGGS
jgi:hypothetical protein